MAHGGAAAAAVVVFNGMDYKAIGMVQSVR